jgi:hypothetical protein
MVGDVVSRASINARQPELVHEFHTEVPLDPASQSATDHTAAGGGICQKLRSATQPRSEHR